jgi:capsular exopolysaccharide synthesis family protein
VDPAEYLRALRRRWAVIASAVAVALAVGWFTSTVVPVGVPTVSYHADVLLLDTGTISQAPSDISSLDTMSSLVTIRPVAERVAKRLGWDGDPMSLAARVQASTGEDSGILSISATGSDPRDAERLADAFTEEFLAFLSDRKSKAIAREQGFLLEEINELTKQIDRLEGRIAGSEEADRELLESERNAMISTYGFLQQQYQQLSTAAAEGDRLQVIQDATAQTVTTEGFQAPRSTSSRLILAGILGLLAGVGLALLLERLDTRIKTRQAAEQHFGLQVLSELPPVEATPNGMGVGGIVTSSQPTSPSADAFRLLAASLAGPQDDQPSRAKKAGGKGRVILVASGDRHEGRTSVVANLAAAFSQVGQRVLILSCDFRHPSLHAVFGFQNGSGLSDALRRRWNGESILETQVRETALPGVSLVPSGSVPPRPSTLLTAPTMGRALEEARKLADVVLIDTPPMLLASDAAHLMGDVDSVLVVARAGKTTAEQAERVRDLLGRLGAPVVGLALNEARDIPLPRSRWLLPAQWRALGGRVFRRG